MKQKLLTFLFAIMASVGITVAKTYSGTCGTNLTWALTTEDGVLTISGEGKMTDYTGSDNAPWYAYRSAITSVTIGKTVTSIGNYAFSHCSSLKSIEIPTIITNIGSSAFFYCSSLISVTIPNDVTSIESFAFMGCNNLKSIVIPNKVTYIGFKAFSHCSSLPSITIPNSVTDIGESTFENCSSLTSITIPNSVTSIGQYAFYYCSSLTSVTIPNSVTGIDDRAFYGCNKLSSITSDAVTPPTLGNDVFYNVDKSIPLYVPAESVEDYALYNGWEEFKNINPIEGSEQEMFTITFKNYDGSILQSTDVKIGTMPVYSYLTPTRPTDAQYTYTFSRWEPEIKEVIGETTYTAVFEGTLNTYTVTWQDEDGNTIKTEEVGYGLTPAFTGTTPTKPATNEYTYEFAGWLPKIQPVTKDMYYTTFFERNKIETPVYTVNINGENCSLNINNQYPEGTVITLEAVADECFEFQQWSDGNKDNPRTITVTANTNLTAEFNKVRYTVTGEPSTGGKVQIRKQ